MRGFADIHNHQLANLAFGGRAVVGDAWGPVEEALSPDTDRANHGIEHTLDHVGSGLARRAVGDLWYGNDGPPRFGGWPAFFEVDHQKVYEKWLRRAVDGGLRLMVMFAVDSPALCEVTGNDGRNCNDEMWTIERQLNAARDLQDAIDAESGGSGNGWYRIVRSPAEARRVIQQGKLAVVLGIETAHLFGCRRGAACDWKPALDYYWNAWGVRHFFPIHHDTNLFGSPSYFAPDIQKTNSLFTTPYWVYTEPCPQYYLGRCSPGGLTTDGQQLVLELMKRGGLIDVDHMSDRAFSDTLDMASTFGYPVVASHAGFNEINRKEQNHDGQLTSDELERIRGVGGMIGLITGQGDIDQVMTYQRPGKHTVDHVCGRTTETFAQAFYYAIDHAPGMSIALGSDFNTPLGQPGPRFGGYQCFKFGSNIAQSMPPNGYPSLSALFALNRDWSKPKWQRMLAYPFIARATGGTLSQYTFGERAYDYNVDGLAHVGLLPDFLADLETLEIPAQDLEPLFKSAEGYVQMWERAEHASQTVMQNGTFEADGPLAQTLWGGSVYQWSVYGLDDQFAARISDAARRSGSSGLEERGGLGIVFQDVGGLQADHVYQVTAWVSWSADSSAPAELWVHDTTGGNVHRRQALPMRGWYPLTFTYTANTTGRVRIHLSRQAGYGSVYWDDVSVQEVSSASLQQVWFSPQQWRWSTQELTAMSGNNGQAIASSGLTSFSKRDDSEHLFYVGTDGRIRQLFYDGRLWNYQDLSAMAAGSSADLASPLTSFVKSNDSEHVFYVSPDRRVRQLVYDGARWYDQNLSAASGSTMTVSIDSGLASFTKTDGSEHVFYVGADQHIHQLVYGSRGWVDQDLTALPGGVSAASGSGITAFAKADRTEHVYYVGLDQHLYQLFWNGAAWYTQNLTAAANNAPLIAPGSGLASFAKGDQTEHVFFIGPSRHVCQLFWNGTRWVYQDLGIASGGNGLSAFTKADQSEHVFFENDEASIAQLVFSGGWVYQVLATIPDGTARQLLLNAVTTFTKSDQSEHAIRFVPSTD
jgi:microsomal dipeptidase-like Zn-dependent dipeptidase